jgi:hypothetical protein
MKRVIAEHDKKQRPDADRQGLDEAAVFKAERDARNAEWQAQRQKQRMNQLESDLREAEGKLRRMQGR